VLSPAVALPLCVPLYGRAEPTLFGFPFFFWFQFALIGTASTLTVIAYRVTGPSDRRRRLVHGRPSETEGAEVFDSDGDRDD
jgi:hypothetical protein